MAIPKIFLTDFRIKRAGFCISREMCICEMIIGYIIFSLAQSFGFLTLIPISIPLLARNFGLVQGVCLPDTGLVLLYFEDFRTGKNNEVITRNNRLKT